MKDEILGRVVGYTVPHQIDASPVEPGEPLQTERTAWARVLGVHGETLVAVSLHDGEEYIFGLMRTQVHTIMPEAYLPPEPVVPVKGMTVVLNHEDDCIVPAGLRRVTSVNPDGSFHVERGNTAIWPRRIIHAF